MWESYQSPFCLLRDNLVSPGLFPPSPLSLRGVKRHGNLYFPNRQPKTFLPKKQDFSQAMQYINNSLFLSWGHSSFVFPHLCLAKSKVCPPFTIFLKRINKIKLFSIILNYFPNCCHTVVTSL